MCDIAVVPAYFQKSWPKVKTEYGKGHNVWLLKILQFQPLLLHLFKGEIELYKPHIQYLWNENNNNTYF